MMVRKKILKIAMAVMMLVAPVAISVAAALPTYAKSCDKESFTETSIFGEDYTIKTKDANGETVKETLHGVCDDGEGSGVYDILSIVLNVLTIGVGVLGVLGIVIAGIQYVTAADNEQQMAKAKQRIIEVVIGLVIYAVMYSVLQWLIPGGIFGK